MWKKTFLLVLIFLLTFAFLGKTLLPKDESLETQLDKEIKNTPSFEAYQEGNRLYLAFLNDEISLSTLKKTKAQLPEIEKLAYAKENNLLPTEKEIRAYIKTQEELYQEDDTIKALADKVMATLGVDKASFFETVVFNNAIFNLTLTNIANDERIKEGKSPIYRAT